MNIKLKNKKGKGTWKKRKRVMTSQTDNTNIILHHVTVLVNRRQSSPCVEDVVFLLISFIFCIFSSIDRSRLFFHTDKDARTDEVHSTVNTK